MGEALLVLGLAEHGEADAGTALLHGEGGAGDVQSALLQQPLPGKGQGLRRHVVDVAAQLHDLRLLGVAALAPEGPDAVGGGEFLFAHAVAGLLQGHDRHGAEACGKLGQQGGAGGGAQLAPDVPGVAGDALQQVGGGGSGHRHDAVGAVDLAAAQMDGGGHDTVGTQHVDCQTDAGDICHRVQSAYLVEMNLLHRHPVGLGLGVRDTGIDGLGSALYLCRDVQGIQQGVNIRRGGVMVGVTVVMAVVVLMVVLVLVVMVMVMFMLVMVVMVMMVLMDMVVPAAQGHIVAVFLLTADGDVHVGACDAAGDSLAGLNFHTGEQTVHHLQKTGLFLWEHQLVQRRHQHIAGSAHVAFQI